MSLTFIKSKHTVPLANMDSNCKFVIYGDKRLPHEIAHINEEIALNDASFFPSSYKEPRQNIRMFIAGSSGAGKSTFAAQFIKQLKTKGRQFFIFSAVEEDEPLDKLEPHRIDLDSDKLEALDVDIFENSVVLFDDIDSHRDKNVVKFVQGLRDIMLERGRHKKIDVINVSHQVMNYRVTKGLLQESNMVTLFPKVDNRSVRKYLAEYQGFDRDEIKKAIDLPSRWICLRNNVPKCLIHERGIYLI